MLNKVNLIGRIGGTPEIKTMSDGDSLASFSLATSEGWKDKTTGEWKEKTEWHKIVCFGFNADKAKNFEKGTLLYVEGQLQTRKWTDKNGNDRYVTEIVLQKFNGMLKSLVKNEALELANTPIASTPELNLETKSSPVINGLDDEIPF
mgnify:FL=1